MTKLTQEEFEEKMEFESGRSRFNPDKYVSWILLRDEEGLEVFYAEYDQDKALREAGLLTEEDDDVFDPDDWAEQEKRYAAVEAYDPGFIARAYASYLAGDEVYIE